jgi:DNA-binding PadR family transcriptional regulator
LTVAKGEDILKYLPLTEPMHYVLLALFEPMHGYGVMQKVEEVSGGEVKLGPGTLYGVFSSLEEEGLIVKLREEERRKVYALTPKGKKVLAAQIRRTEKIAKTGAAILGRLTD